MLLCLGATRFPLIAHMGLAHAAQQPQTKSEPKFVSSHVDTEQRGPCLGRLLRWYIFLVSTADNSTNVHHEVEPQWRGAFSAPIKPPGFSSFCADSLFSVMLAALRKAVVVSFHVHHGFLFIFPESVTFCPVISLSSLFCVSFWRFSFWSCSTPRTFVILPPPVITVFCVFLTCI